MHLAAELGQHALGHQLVHRVVLHQQDARAALFQGDGRGRQRVFGLVALQGAAQGLVQGVARQRPGQLVQGGEGDRLFAGQEVAVGGHQQDRCLQCRAQFEQLVQAVGDQQVDGRGVQPRAAVMVLVGKAPGGQQVLQQFIEPAAGRAQRRHAPVQRCRRDGFGVHRQRQLGGEAAAEARVGLDMQVALHGLAQVACQRQAQAGAAVLAGDAGAGLGERLEDPRLGFFGDADAGVAHFQAHTADNGRQAHIHAAEAGELEGVGQQVADDLPYPRGVAKHAAGEVAGDQAGQLHALRGVLRQQVGGVLDHRAHVEGDTLQFQLAGIELGQVENIVEQLHQHLARVVGNRQLLALLTGQRAVQGQGDHAEHAVERGADLVAHVGQERGTCLGHVQGALTGFLQFLIGLAQAAVAGLELGGARRNDVFQLIQVLGQAIVGGAPLLDLGGHADELLVGDLDQHTDLVVFVAMRAFQARLPGLARIAAAERADHRHQRFGQHHVEQRQENAGEYQAAGETVDQGDAGAIEKAAAEGIGIDIQVQGAEVFIGHVCQVQAFLELAQLAEQKVAQGPVAVFEPRALDVGQHGVVVVDQPRANDGRRLQQATGQLQGQFGVDVVGDARRRVMADLQQRLHFAVDGRVFAGIIDADLDETEQCSQDEADQDCQPGLLV
ncbi:hypothetical protein D3C79_491940 [compost metagenome]